MQKKVPRESPCHCINVRRAANALTKFYDRAVEPIGLTISQFSLLNDIRLLGACNKSELAQYAGLERTTVIRNLEALRKKGLVAETDGATRRSRLIQLTDKGEQAIAAGMPLWKQAQVRARDVMGQQLVEGIAQALESIETLAREG